MSSQVRRAASEIREDYARFGGAPIPADMGPAEILLERVRVMAAYVRWLDSKIQGWPDDLVELGVTNYDSKGSMQNAVSHKGAWLAEWHTSNDALVKYVQICLAANIDERRVALAERESETIMALLEAAFDRLELTADQMSRVPVIMGEVIRGRIASDGEAAPGTHDAD